MKSKFVLTTTWKLWIKSNFQLVSC